ncbi:MAG: hypothetical protein DI587_10955 [Variovorax paradoxus]|nr:MAG: hypothetical protein DI583_10955 [Variovorax paradoxus]PZQ10971.1 MAG: hypothetical protein DI587_10955 [Variovorax paradoxus]
MQQVRISTSLPPQSPTERFTCEWMEGSMMNRWLLKGRLAEALAAHGERTHWIETRDKPLVQRMALA